MMNTSVNSRFADDTNPVSDLALNYHSNSVARKIALCISFVFAVSGTAALAAQAAEPAPSKVTSAKSADPLKGDVWHAINGTWPGTLVFDGKSKKVVLTPVGAQAIQADYTLSKVETKGNETKGALRMTRAEGSQVVTATFVITGRNALSLRYTDGQREESYQRMTPKEEEAEKARLMKMLQEKKTTTSK